MSPVRAAARLTCSPEHLTSGAAPPPSCPGVGLGVGRSTPRRLDPNSTLKRIELPLEFAYTRRRLAVTGKNRCSAGDAPHGVLRGPICYACPPLRKVYVLMQQKDASHSPEVHPLADSTTKAPRGMAKVLERAIAPDLVPPSVRLDDSQVDTATYIAELADIARHHRQWTAAAAACPWIRSQET